MSAGSYITALTEIEGKRDAGPRRMTCTEAEVVQQAVGPLPMTHFAAAVEEA